MKKQAGLRIWLGAALGIVGLATIFLPGIGSAGFGSDPVPGFALALAGTYSFSIGNIISAGYPARDIPDFLSNACSMLFGAHVTLLRNIGAARVGYATIVSSLSPLGFQQYSKVSPGPYGA